MKKTFIIVITLTLGLVSAKAQETADEYEQQITAAYVRNDMKTLDEQLASWQATIRAVSIPWMC